MLYLSEVKEEPNKENHVKRMLQDTLPLGVKAEAVSMNLGCDHAC